MLYGAGFHRPDRIGETIDEGTVVDRGQDRSRKSVERLLESLTRVYVQMVDGFIQDQAVGSLSNQFRQEQA